MTDPSVKDMEKKKMREQHKNVVNEHLKGEQLAGLAQSRSRILDHAKTQ